MTEFVVTANRLGDGEVVYLTQDKSWSVDLQDGVVLQDEAAKDALAAVERPAEELKIVGPYSMKVAVTEAGIEPLGQREVIRAKGPTTHLHFGKQAEEGAGHV